MLDKLTKPGFNDTSIPTRLARMALRHSQPRLDPDQTHDTALNGDGTLKTKKDIITSHD